MMTKPYFEHLEPRCAAMRTPVAPKWMRELMLVIYGLAASILLFNYGAF